MLFQKKAPVSWLVVGLGNPGGQYENTRHNAGFLTADELARRGRFAIQRLKFKALTAAVEISGQGVLMMKPTTFMNNSGEAIAEAARFYKIAVGNIIVLFDDISLEPGLLRIRRKGSDGGHNGIKSIIYATGEEAFPRIKLGVGQKPRSDYDLAAWVLSAFTDAEQKKLQSCAENACKAVELMVGGEIDKAMNLYNS